MSQSARRRARRHAKEIYPPIRGISDGFATALALHAQLPRARACFLFTSEGVVEGGWALTEGWHTLDHALSLALAIPDRCVQGRLILFVSTHDDDDLTVLAEDDVATWHRLRRAAGARGAVVVDWIQASADQFRSLLLSTEPGADWII